MILDKYINGDEYRNTEPVFTDEQLAPMRQLINFSDCEGILVPRWCLRDVDYKDSTTLGCTDDLYDELNVIKDWILHNTKRVHERTMEIFNMLYDLVAEAVEGKGILHFH